MKIPQIVRNALPKIYVKIHRMEKIPEVIPECMDFGRCWVGYGLHQERSVNQIDRFIMVRHPVTQMTAYYFWTGKRRGEELSIVRQFVPHHEVTFAYVEDHFANPISRGLLKRHGLHGQRVRRFDLE